MYQPKKSKTIKDAAREYRPVYLPRHKFHCGRKDYEHVMKRLNELIAEQMVKGELLCLKLPHGLGEIRMEKHFTPDDHRRRIDFKKTKELGMTIYHDNSHSHGYFGEMKYDKSKARYRNKTIYSFEPVRAVSRGMAKEIIENNVVLKYIG